MQQKIRLVSEMPPRTRALIAELSIAHYGETQAERISRVEWALMQLCAQLEYELEANRCNMTIV